MGKTGLTRRIRWGRGSLGVALGLGLLAASVVDCGNGASCDAVCSNVLSKCSSALDSVAKNQCLEECTQRIQPIDQKCAVERDAVLRCLSDAPSIDCADPQKSASCASQNTILSHCMGGTTTVGGSATSSGSAGGPSCNLDKDCTTGLCNTKLEQCTTPGAIGTPCYLSKECSNGLCNTNLDQCADPGGLGTPCYLSKECTNGLCNTNLNQCADPAALGSPCYLDKECANGLCNTNLDQCAVAAPSGSLCYRAKECVSGVCNGATNTCG